MSVFSVVLDACVLYPAVLRDTLLRTAGKGLCRVYWSTEILEETTRNLIKTGRMNEAGTQRLVNARTAAFPEAAVVGYEPLIPSMTNHPKDRHVAAAAVHCHAQAIITTNLRDFQESALLPHGTKALHPDWFLCSLLDLDQARVLQVIYEQAADLRRPPRTMLDVLEMLGGIVPTFAEIVHDLLPPALRGPS
jgi:predicted nucleic acid-binding protein